MQPPRCHTLTTGIMTVHQITTAAWTEGKEALLLAGAVDASEHPIGRAVAAEAARRLGPLPPPMTDFTSLPGAGVQGNAGGRTVTVGSPSSSPRCTWPSPPNWTGRSKQPETRA